MPRKRSPLDDLLAQYHALPEALRRQFLTAALSSPDCPEELRPRLLRLGEAAALTGFSRYKVSRYGTRGVLATHGRHGTRHLRIVADWRLLDFARAHVTRLFRKAEAEESKHYTVDDLRELARQMVRNHVTGADDQVEALADFLVEDMEGKRRGRQQKRAKNLGAALDKLKGSFYDY
jgi:hypothetical protein